MIPTKDVDVVSSVDKPYAVSDTLKETIRQTKRSLLVFAPYIGKNFVDMIRGYVPAGVEIKVLTKTPDEGDVTFMTLEAFNEVSNSSGYRLSIMCNPFLHAKFMIVDDAIVLSGSVNPTSSGIYYNSEIIYTFSDSELVKFHVHLFDKIWKDNRNIKWENLQQFSRYKGYSLHHSIRKKISEAIVQHFIVNKNQQMSKSSLVERCARTGFYKEEVIETIKNLIDEGVLYAPSLDMLKLTNYQVNIDDFNEF